VTAAAFALALLCALGPSWLRWCLLNPLLLRPLEQTGFGASVLGAMTTLFLLFRTEPPRAAYSQLAGIGWAVLLLTGMLFGMVMGNTLFPVIPALVGGSVTGQLTRVAKVLLSLLPGVPILCAFVFVVITLPFSLVKIRGRFKAAALLPLASS